MPLRKSVDTTTDAPKSILTRGKVAIVFELSLTNRATKYIKAKTVITPSIFSRIAQKILITFIHKLISVVKLFR